MRPLALLLPLVSALPGPPKPGTTHRIPTSYESAVLGRRILALTPLGTISTVFPANSSSSQPPHLAGHPHAIMSYLAACDPSSPGDPTLLALSIETTFRNVRAGSNVSLALAWTPPHAPAQRIERVWSALAGDVVPAPSQYSAANLPRFSLMGYTEPIPTGNDDEAAAALADCFVRAHPDARYWLPGNRIHEARFVRLVVREVYWVGGFGDRAYIGWIPADEWHGVTRAEWERVRLPGEEKGWKEWSSGGDDL